MGSGIGGGPRASVPSLQSNIANSISRFVFSNKAQKFGVPGTGRARVIESEDPQGMAKEFFNKLSAGSSKSNVAGGVLAKFPDGSTLFMRLKSKSGGPAVNLKVLGSRPQRYKVHFEKLSQKNEKEN